MANIPSRLEYEQILLASDPETQQIMLDVIKNKKFPWIWTGTKLIEASDSLEPWLDKFITCDPQMIAMKNDVRKLARVQDEVLIFGETGTGKEILAHALHGDRKGEFIGINCAGLPAELIESELFGYVRGAFTGASGERNGLMTVASEGTLFLDEIGEMPMHVQGKLLRAIQEKKLRKVGGKVEENITCRIVCATNRNIPEMCKNNLFRLDLYARIAIFELHPTCLCDRRHDIAEILMLGMKGGADLLEAMNANYQKDKIGFLWTERIDLDLNVRSLERHVRRYKVLGKLPEINL